MPGGHPSVLVIEIARIIAVLFRMPRGIHLIKPAASCDLTGKLTTLRPIRLPPSRSIPQVRRWRAENSSAVVNPRIGDRIGKRGERAMAFRALPISASQMQGRLDGLDR